MTGVWVGRRQTITFRRDNKILVKGVQRTIFNILF